MISKRKAKTIAHWPHIYAKRVSKIHFAYVLAHFGLIISFDSWNLLTKDSINQRWTLIAGLFVLNIIVWFMARIQFQTNTWYKLSIFSLAIYDILIASMFVYWERGMASLSVSLFFVPIIIVAALRSQGLLVATALLSGAAYSTAAVRYFNDNYGEGFRVQLWGTVVFYSFVFFVMAWLLIAVLHTPKREHLK